MLGPEPLPFVTAGPDMHAGAHHELGCEPMCGALLQADRTGRCPVPVYDTFQMQMRYRVLTWSLATTARHWSAYAWPLLISTVARSRAQLVSQLSHRGHRCDEIAIGLDMKTRTWEFKANAVVDWNSPLHALRGSVYVMHRARQALVGIAYAHDTHDAIRHWSWCTELHRQRAVHTRRAWI